MASPRRKPRTSPSKSRLTRTRSTLTAEHIARIGALEQKVADLVKRLDTAERRLETLESSWPSGHRWPKLPDPAWPVKPDPTPWPSIMPQYVEPTCSTCGNRFKDMTHYVCNHLQCPSKITYWIADRTSTASPLGELPHSTCCAGTSSNCACHNAIHD